MPSARLFVALDLPAEVRERFAALVPSRPELRPVPVEALHVTLVFIGHRPEEEVDEIAAAFDGSVRGLRARRAEPGGGTRRGRRSRNRR